MTEQPILTIFCSFTRRWAIERWLGNLRQVQHDPARTNLAIIVDVDEPYIATLIKRYVEEHGYRALQITINRENNPNEVRIPVRRQAIAAMKNQSKHLISQLDGDIIIGLEDDTVFPDLDLARLYQPLLDDDTIGFVEGVQCGRWGVKIIGAWSFDDFEFPQKGETLLPQEGYQPIDAGGFYGYATRRKLYLNHDYHSATSQPWGPDVNYGLWLRSQGFKCLIDWQSVFGHNDYDSILYPDVNVSKVVYTKDITTGKWGRNDTDKAS